MRRAQQHRRATCGARTARARRREGSTAFSCAVSPGDEARAWCEALLPVTRDNGRRRPLDVLLLLRAAAHQLEADNPRRAVLTLQIVLAAEPAHMQARLVKRAITTMLDVTQAWCSNNSLSLLHVI